MLGYEMSLLHMQKYTHCECGNEIIFNIWVALATLTSNTVFRDSKNSSQNRSRQQRGKITISFVNSCGYLGALGGSGGITLTKP